MHYNYAIKCTTEANRYSSSIYPLARLTRAADFLLPSTDFDLKKKNIFAFFSFGFEIPFYNEKSFFFFLLPFFFYLIQ